MASDPMVWIDLVNTKNMDGCNINVHDRTQAGILLGRKLKGYRHSNAIIIGISKGGAIVAHAIANYLDLPLEIFPCRKISYPSDTHRSIASVSLDEIVIHNHLHDIPQDYIVREATSQQRDLLREVEFYGENWDSISLEGRVVIMVDDLMRSGDTMASCIRCIEKRNPSRIIVAVPFVSAESVLLIEENVGDVVFARMEVDIDTPDIFFEQFPEVSEVSVKNLLLSSRKLQLQLP